MNDAVAPVPDTAPPDQEYAYPPEPPDADPLNVTVLPTVGFGEAEHVPVSWLPPLIVMLKETSFT